MLLMRFLYYASQNSARILSGQSIYHAGRLVKCLLNKYSYKLFEKQILAQI